MTILYADDDDEDQEVFAEIVDAINPEIIILRAKDGLQAIEILSGKEAPDIIFLDFNMPFLNGHQVLKEIRKEEKYNHTKVTDSPRTFMNMHLRIAARRMSNT